MHVGSFSDVMRDVTRDVARHYCGAINTVRRLVNSEGPQLTL